MTAEELADRIYTNCINSEDIATIAGLIEADRREVERQCAEREWTDERLLRLYEVMSDIATECIEARCNGRYLTVEETQQAIAIPRLRAAIISLAEEDKP